MSGPFDNDEVYQGLYKRINELSAPTKEGNIEVLYYMAVPPNLIPVITFFSLVSNPKKKYAFVLVSNTLNQAMKSTL